MIEEEERVCRFTLARIFCKMILKLGVQEAKSL